MSSQWTCRSGCWPGSGAAQLARGSPGGSRRASFAELWTALRPGALLLVIEPKGHVSAADFETSMQVAIGAGFEVAEQPVAGKPRSAVLRRPVA
ncbi:MAG: hypothetical protein MUF10_07070 [Thermoanaerobaculaceae bacterium]|nr:hypothetical protein [Thermoanaerobaculaceae bacterium]